MEDQISTCGDVLGLKDALSNYDSVLEDLDAENLVASYTAQKLEEKLRLPFKEHIIIHKGKYKRGGSLIYNSNITLEEALLADLQKSKLDQRIKDVAFTLRAIIKSATRTNIPSNGIRFDDIIDGEVQISEQLPQFFTHLVVGQDHRSHESTSKRRRVESLAADTVCSVTNGRKKPSKHLKLGLAVKSMKESRRLIGMLNRYAHCVGYTTTEEFEMDITFTVTSTSKISPPNLVPDSSLTVRIAHDNFDQFVETLSGKDTLHGTVSIVYQSVSEETSGAAATAPENCPFASGDSMSRRKRRRRTFESFAVDIEPYHKKPKISSLELMPLGCTDRQQIPESYQLAKVNDLLWMIQFSILPKSILT